MIVDLLRLDTLAELLFLEFIDLTSCSDMEMNLFTALVELLDEAIPYFTVRSDSNGIDIKFFREEAKISKVILMAI